MRQKKNYRTTPYGGGTFKKHKNKNKKQKKTKNKKYKN